MESEASEQQDGKGAVPPVLHNKLPSQTTLKFDAERSEAEANHGSVFRFDLFTSPSCIFTIIFLGALMAYGVTDSMPLGETYTAGYPYGMFALFAAAVAGVVWAITAPAKLPIMVAAGLAFTGAVVGAAVAHPALLRANAWTDVEALQPVEYVRTSENRFEAVEGYWPGIDMIGKAHWLAMPGEVRRIILIRRGGLGFYQADLTGIRFELEMSSHEGETG